MSKRTVFYYIISIFISVGLIIVSTLMVFDVISYIFWIVTIGVAIDALAMLLLPKLLFTKEELLKYKTNRKEWFKEYRIFQIVTVLLYVLFLIAYVALIIKKW